MITLPRTSLLELFLLEQCPGALIEAALIEAGRPSRCSTVAGRGGRNLLNASRGCSAGKFFVGPAGFFRPRRSLFEMASFEMASRLMPNASGRCVSSGVGEPMLLSPTSLAKIGRAHV